MGGIMKFFVLLGLAAVGHAAYQTVTVSQYSDASCSTKTGEFVVPSTYCSDLGKFDGCPIDSTQVRKTVSPCTGAATTYATGACNAPVSGAVSGIASEKLAVGDSADDYVIAVTTTDGTTSTLHYYASGACGIATSTGGTVSTYSFKYTATAAGDGTNVATYTSLDCSGTAQSPTTVVSGGNYVSAGSTTVKMRVVSANTAARCATA